MIKAVCDSFRMSFPPDWQVHGASVEMKQFTTLTGHVERSGNREIRVMVCALLRTSSASVPLSVSLCLPGLSSQGTGFLATSWGAVRSFPGPFWGEHGWKTAPPPTPSGSSMTTLNTALRVQ